MITEHEDFGDWRNEKASVIARLAFGIFDTARLTRDEQRQVLAIMGSALCVDSPLHHFLEQVGQASHSVAAPAADTEDVVRSDCTQAEDPGSDGPGWKTGDSSSWQRGFDDKHVHEDHETPDVNSLYASRIMEGLRVV